MVSLYSAPMRQPTTILAHTDGLCLRAERLGVRTRAVGPGEQLGPGVPLPLVFEADDLVPGVRRLGGLEIDLERIDHGDAASFQLSVCNVSNRELFVESVVVGFRFEGYGAGQLRFLRHGWQSWSPTETLDLDPAATPDFPPGPWLRGMFHVLDTSFPDRAGWQESHIATVAGGSAGACMAGVLETGSSFGVVYLRELRSADRSSGSRAEDGSLALEVELLLEVPLAVGERRRLDSVRVALGTQPNRLLEAFAELWGRVGGARTRAPFRVGWCSWYHFFHRVNESDLLRNLEALAAAREEIPVDVVQLDDGFQRAVGDWLETNEKFPRGLAPLAEAIAAAGFVPGIWTAPFCLAPESRVFAQHSEWLLRGDDGPLRAVLNPEWARQGWVYALDTTREEVRAHLRSLYRELVEMGFGYLKLDFLYAPAMRGEAHDRRRTRAERLRLGLDAVREGAGDEAFLLGCGCPLGPAVGVVDAMRIGPDVAPSWLPERRLRTQGLEPAMPSLRNALRNILHRSWMHRRLWINDPDCLMARTSETELSPDEVRSLAAAIAASGGLVAISDDVPQLAEESRALIRDTAALAREVDAVGPRGACRALGLLAAGGPRALAACCGTDAVLAVFNTGDATSRVRIELADIGLGRPETAPQPLLGGRVCLEPLPTAGGTDAGAGVAAFEAELQLHQAALSYLRDVRKLAVFCDFDGTFSRQDVGASLVIQHRLDRHADNWARYRSGEITAWEYNCAVIDGLELPREELDVFLESVEIDPGGGALVAWCEEREVPFRILSDGFDYNLERLQQIHGVRFDYASNRLRYEGDTWCIAPGHPNPDCRCGTGSCKRGLIFAYRSANPGAFCVHIGNGYVSDLCGAQAADLTFAKDSLASALDQRGEAYLSFETLHDVRAVLSQLYRPYRA
jgi:alpha-galactosidase